MLRPTAVLAALACAAAVPATPPPVSPEARRLQRLLDAAAAAPPVGGVVVLPAGEYVFSDQSFTLTNARDLVIHGEGVRLVFYFGSGFSMTGCVNVTVTGLVLDADPPNYAQGVVTAVDPSAQTFTADFDGGFLTPASQVTGAKVSFWDPDTRLLAGFAGFLAAPPVPVGTLPASPTADSAWNVTLKQQLPAAAAVGNLVTVFGRRGQTFAARGCGAVTAENITIHAGGNMGFLEASGAGGNVYRNVRIVRKPGWRGLMANNADGFHSNANDVGPTIVGSEISFTGDDFLNIHNRMEVVCKALGPTQLAVVMTSGGALDKAAAGDAMKFYEVLSGTPTHANPYIASGTVVSIARANSTVARQCHQVGDRMMAAPYNVHFVPSIQANLRRAEVFVLEFAPETVRAVAAHPYSLMNQQDYSNKDFYVAGNSFHDSCGSGGRVLSKSISGGMFADNVVARGGGVFVTTEQCWLEGSLGITGVTIKDNVVIDAAGPSTHIEVLAGLKNITCANNTFVVRGNATVRLDTC
eukprot:TRINITY_DN16605_c0_g1_i1.p1 TRINITY_DN16605_c0_g1~~TRINITY_DN16605_c0_g1_i1.p1  ORF type:complete len:525 (+),score=173.79 TRINITY_DN16605_c0_g1_i1:56-1630(+)